ncbi:MAG: response regulator transcription factor [Synergistaceae bacterium]|nr:response regulator transcription factor [Synergistaceae bacterium]
MTNHKVLVVDDEPAIVDLVRQLLLRRGYEVITAVDGDAALQMIYDAKPDLVVLDLMLPKLSGWEVCRRVKEDEEVRSTPILMLTARREDRDLVAGLELGADDYVKKPFSTAELSARISAILRRSKEEKTIKQLTNGDLYIDLENESASLRGVELSLSLTEFRLLALLTERMSSGTPEGVGKTVTRETLLSCIWNSLEYDTRAVDVYISRLRKKLNDGKTPALTIQSRRGRGYRLVWELQGEI